MKTIRFKIPVRHESEDVVNNAKIAFADQPGIGQQITPGLPRIITLLTVIVTIKSSIMNHLLSSSLRISQTAPPLLYRGELHLEIFCIPTGELHLERQLTLIPSFPPKDWQERPST